MTKSLWSSMSHNGVAFPPSYQSQGLTVSTSKVITGKGWLKITLSPLAEEMLFAIAKKKDTPYIQDPVFTANFMKSLSQAQPEFQGLSFPDLDLSPFFSLVESDKATKANLTSDQKKALAKSKLIQKEATRSMFGFATVDNKQVPIQNFVVEPPSLFMGRGLHPLRGTWKPRILPEDVTINLGESAPVMHVPGHEWHSVVHDHSSIWFARWLDPISGKWKYVWPDPGSSSVVSSRQISKYDKALKVSAKLSKIRMAITNGIESKDETLAQTATAAYLIDTLGFRVGNEKSAGEADTVGCTTLRVEHVKIHPRGITFNFLGKDSMRCIKELPAGPINFADAVFSNLARFTKGKNPGDLVFDKISSGDVNRFFSQQMPGLSAKVFRTFHATTLVQDYLNSHDTSKSSPIEKLRIAKLANLEAAIFCNHKRTIPKNFAEQLAKKEAKLSQYKATNKTVQAEKLELSLSLTSQTADYNLGTSLANYIDPRVFKVWCGANDVSFDKLYSKSLQKKFSWV